MVQWAMGWFRDDVMFGWAEFQSWLKIAETLFLPNKGKKWEKQRGSRIALPLETIPSESMCFKISWTWRGWKNHFPRENTPATRPRAPVPWWQHIAARSNHQSFTHLPCLQRSEPHLITGCFGPDTTQEPHLRSTRVETPLSWIAFFNGPVALLSG